MFLFSIFLTSDIYNYILNKSIRIADIVQKNTPWLVYPQSKEYNTGIYCLLYFVAKNSNSLSNILTYSNQMVTKLYCCDLQVS